MPHRKQRQTTTPDKTEHDPGLLNALAQSPAALAGYLGLHRRLARGRLSAADRCLVGLMVAQRSGSAYWLSVQSRIAVKAGLTKQQIQEAREGCAKSERQTALLFLAGKLVVNRGELAAADLAAARRTGLLADADIAEVILHVALNLTAAAIGHAAALKLDFPAAPSLAAL